MDTRCLVDAGVFFIFFDSFLFGLFYFLFWGPCDFFFFCRTAPLHQPFGFFWTLCGFFFKSFLGASVTLHS